MPDNLFKVFPIVIGDKEYPVFFNDDRKFHCEAHGIEAKSETWAGLQDAVKDKAKEKKIRIAIRFAKWRPKSRFSREYVYTEGSVVGINRATDNLEIKWDDGGTEQMRSYASESNIFRPLTGDEQKKYATLEAAYRKANEAFDAFKESVEVDLRKLAIAAIDAAKNTN